MASARERPDPPRSKDHRFSTGKPALAQGWRVTEGKDAAQLLNIFTARSSTTCGPLVRQFATPSAPRFKPGGALRLLLALPFAFPYVVFLRARDAAKVVSTRKIAIQRSEGETFA